MSCPVAIVGAFNQDLTWRCREFPRPGQTIFGPFTTGPGGKGSNQAVACQRTGIPTAFIGAVGDDTFGKGAEAFLQAEGIETHLTVKAGHPTGNAAIWVADSGENQIIVAPGANLELKMADIPRKVIESASVLLCQLESNIDATLDALEYAKYIGTESILNCAPMPDDFNADWLDDVTILMPNETEFASLVRQFHGGQYLTYTEDEILANGHEELHQLCRTFHIPDVIITLGKAGCFVSSPAGFHVIEAHTGIEVVDTTGAGDAFAGAFAAGLVEFGGDRVKAAEFANTVAALSVTKPGTAPSMPSREEIDAFLKGPAS